MDPKNYYNDSLKCEQICKELMKSIYQTTPKTVDHSKTRELLTDLQELLIFWGP